MKRYPLWLAGWLLIGVAVQAAEAPSDKSSGAEIEASLIALAKDEEATRFERLNAMYRLAKRRTPKAVAVLMELATSETGRVQSDAVFQLGRAQSKKALPLLRKLCAHKDDFVRAHAAAGLGWLPDIKSVPVLVTLVWEDGHASVRENAARSLGYIGGKKALDALHGALYDEHHNVRYNVVLALKRLKHPSSAPLLQRVIDEYPWCFSITADEARKTIELINTEAKRKADEARKRAKRKRGPGAGIDRGARIAATDKQWIRE